MKLIDAIKLVQEHGQWVNSINGIGQRMVAVKDILSAPVEYDNSVIFSKWEPVEDENGQLNGYSKCAHCGWRNEVLPIDTVYCPSCGAVMFCS